MKIITGISAVVLFICRILIYIFCKKIDTTYKIIVIVGVIFAGFTLYFNFLKPANLKIIIGKRAILIWHDKNLRYRPMMDVFCTFLNNGARPVVIDEIQIELSKDNTKTTFTDYILLKLVNGKERQQDEYSHSVIINKYSEQSMMIGFKGKSENYKFIKGKYALEVKAINKNKCIAEDKIEFALSEDKIKDIEDKKYKLQTESTEVNLD